MASDVAAADATSADRQLYGLLLEFDEPEQLVEAARSMYKYGYRKMDAYTPMPVEGLAEAIGFRRTRLPAIVLAGGLLGGAAGFALQYWVSVYAYPLNVGGRPLNSWPAFVPVTFECTILGASLAGVLGMLALNGLPRPHHPLFAMPEFDKASQTSFFLCLEARDPLFATAETERLLEQLDARAILEVPDPSK